jgi:hypothetical protein
LQHLGLVALLGGLLCATFADGNGSGGDGEEREAGAQAEGRQGGEEEAEDGPWCGVEEERGIGRLEQGKDGSCISAGSLVFLGGSCLCEELEGDRVREIGLA